MENIPFNVSDENVLIFVESLRSIEGANYTIDGPRNGSEMTVVKITSNLQHVLDSEDVTDITVEVCGSNILHILYCVMNFMMTDCIICFSL